MAPPSDESCAQTSRSEYSIAPIHALVVGLCTLTPKSVEYEASSTTTPFRQYAPFLVTEA